jgi:hypothetical protein
MWKAIKGWVSWYAQEITAIVVLIVAAAAVVFFCNEMTKRRCYSAYAQFQPEYVGMITGCMITVDEQRVPANSLRMTL